MQNIVTKGWGYELWIENNDLYCGKHLHVLPTKWCSVHYHYNKTETFYVIHGELLLEWCDAHPSFGLECNIEFWNDIAPVQQYIIKCGDHFTLKPLMPHRFTSNLSYPCDFIEISTHHEDSDSYRIIKGD